MLPIEENPLQKTLERIAEKQAELVKSKDCFNHNFFTSKDANAEKCNLSSQPSEDPQSKQNILMKQQQKLLEDAIINQQKQKQQEEVLDFSEKASTLPLGNVSSKAKTDNISNENSLASQESQIMKSPSAIIPTQSNKELDPLPRTEPIQSTSLKATFDFSKTPRSFLSSSTISQPTPKPWTKFNHNSDASRPQSTEPLKVKAAPKLEFLGSEVTRHLPPAVTSASVESLEKNKSFTEKLSNGAVSVCFIIFVKILASKVLNVLGSN